MKRTAFFIMTFLLSASLICGQTKTTEKQQKKEVKKETKAKLVPLKKLEGKTVSTKAKNNFITDIGNIPDAKWTRSVNFDEVVYTKGGKQYTGYYDFEGNLVGTTSDAKFSDLPSSAQRTIESKYKDYTIGKVIFYDDNEANATDMVLYGLQFEDADNYFVELAKGPKRIVVQATTEGDVFFFKQL